MHLGSSIPQCSLGLRAPTRCIASSNSSGNLGLPAEIEGAGFNDRRGQQAASAALFLVARVRVKSSLGDDQLILVDWDQIIRSERRHREFHVIGQASGEASPTEQGPWVGNVTAGKTSLGPLVGVPLAGSALPAQIGSCTEGSLECNVLVIHDEDRPQVVIVTIDAPYVGSVLRNAVVDALADRVDGNDIFLFASHTHQAPATDPDKPVLGSVDDATLTQIITQVTGVCSAAVDSQPRVVRAAVRGTKSRHAVNRRRRFPVLFTRHGLKLGAVRGGSDRNGKVDEDLLLITVADEENGDVVAVLWNFACHPVGHPHPEEVSAHFIGVVREAIRAKYNNADLPVLFFQGFSGDLRPRSASTMRSKYTGLRRLAQPVGCQAFTASDYASWTRSLAQAASSALLSEPSPIKGEGCRVIRHEMPRTSFVNGSDNDAPVSFAALDLGSNVAVVDVSAEAVVAYAEVVRSIAGREFVLLAGCMDDVFGYAPTAKMLTEGGYEVEGFCRALSCTALTDEIEDAMIAGFSAVTGNRSRDVIPSVH